MLRMLQRVSLASAGPKRIEPRPQWPITLESRQMKKFEPGRTYFGTLSCAHSDFPVLCVKRTDKSVWFTKPGYRDKRCKAHMWDGYETAIFHGWYLSADKTTGGDFDPMTI